MCSVSKERTLDRLLVVGISFEQHNREDVVAPHLERLESGDGGGDATEAEVAHEHDGQAERSKGVELQGAGGALCDMMTS